MMRRLLLPLLLLAAACSSTRRENIQPPTDLEDFAATVSLQRLWSRDLGDLGGKPGLAMSVAHVDGRLYGANVDGDLLTLDAASGSELGRVRTGYPFSSTPGVGEGVAAIGTLDGRVVVIDLAGGQERFVAQLNAEVIAAPVIAEGRVVVRSHDGRITAFNLSDGSRAWTHEGSVPALSLRGNGAPLYDRGYVLVGQDDGRVIALRANDGTQVWAQQVGMPEGRTDLERLADVDGEMRIGDGVLYAAGYEGQAVAIDIAGGTPIWGRDQSAAAGVALGERIYVSGADGRVVALDRVGGDAYWTQEGLLHRWLTTPAVVADRVAVADFQGYLHVLSPADGSFAARTRVARDAVRAAPLVVAPDTVVVTATDGTVAAYRVGG